MEHSARRFVGWVCTRHDIGVPHAHLPLAALYLLSALGSAAHAEPLVYTGGELTVGGIAFGNSTPAQTLVGISPD